MEFQVQPPLGQADLAEEAGPAEVLVSNVQDKAPERLLVEWAKAATVAVLPTFNKF